MSLPMLPLYPFTPLPVPTSNKYLISFHCTTSSYTIFLTDLTTLYRESLNAEEIAERADVPPPPHPVVFSDQWDNESPIDPGTEKDFKRSMEKLRTALTTKDDSIVLTLSKQKQVLTLF